MSPVQYSPKELFLSSNVGFRTDCTSHSLNTVHQSQQYKARL